MEIINEPTIINAKEIVVDNGCYPNRIVLRKWDGAFAFITCRENLVVENDKFIHKSFYSGNYFHNLKEAEADFIRRK